MKIQLVTLSILLAKLACGQQENFVATEGIKNPIHQQNIGKIRFMEKAIAADKVKESDYISSFDYNGNSDLNIRI